MSQAERRSLRSLGVRFGAFSLFMPALLEPAALAFAGAFAAQEGPQWAPPSGRISALPGPAPSPRVLAARGLRACGPYAVPVRALEQLDEILRAAPRDGGGAVLSDAALEPLGWPAAAAGPVLRALGYAPVRRKTEGAAATVWRRRAEAARPPAVTVRPDSPFAALAALAAPAPPPIRRKRRKVRKARAAS